jgi:hypothetical protein
MMKTEHLADIQGIHLMNELPTITTEHEVELDDRLLLALVTRAYSGKIPEGAVIRPFNNAGGVFGGVRVRWDSTPTGVLRRGDRP